MPEREPSEQERIQASKDAMTRELMDVHGISYDAARMLVEEMFHKAREEALSKKTKEEDI